MKVCFVIHKMGPGGAERVMASLANAMAGSGHGVYLLVVDGESGSFFPLHEGVRFCSLDSTAGRRSGKLSGNLAAILSMRRSIAGIRPDVVVSFITETNVRAILACIRLCPVVVSEHTDPWTCPTTRIWSTLRKWFYPWARTIVVLNERAKRYFAGYRTSLAVIPNPLPHNVEHAATGANAESGAGREKSIIAIGRLAPEKRLDLVIDAFNIAAADLPGWRLDIVGDGPEKQALLARAAKSAQSSRIFFHGPVRDVVPLLRKARIYLSASELEGLPMSFIEAMSCGVPIVAAEYNESIAELVDAERSGLVVGRGDVTALASATVRLAQDGDLWRRLSRAGREKAGVFSMQQILPQWERALTAAAG